MAAVFVPPKADRAEVAEEALHQRKIVCAHGQYARRGQGAEEPDKISERVVLGVAPFLLQFLECVASEADVNPLHRIARVDRAGNDVVEPEQVF